MPHIAFFQGSRKKQAGIEFARDTPSGRPTKAAINEKGQKCCDRLGKQLVQLLDKLSEVGKCGFDRLGLRHIDSRVLE